MINKNILEKSVMAKEELDGFYNAQFEPMEFPWLSDVKAWIEKGYDVKIMTILYEFTIDKIHKFTLYLYSYEQHKNIPLVGDNFWEYHCEEIETIISHYLEPVHIESKSTQKRVDMRNNTHSFSVNSFNLIVF